MLVYAGNMLRSRLFWQWFIALSLLTVLSVGLLGTIVMRQTEINELRLVEEHLRGKAILVQEIVRERSLGQVRDLLDRFNQVHPELATRITLIDAAGRVLVETSDDPARLENHGQRPEVVQARQQGLGRATRFSNTLGQEMMYVAVRTDDPSGAIAFVRVALPLTNIQQELLEMRRLIWSAVGLIAVLALGLAFFLARRLTHPLQILTEGAELIAAGNYGHRVYLDGRDEIGTLARTFNHMSARLAGQFQQLEEDRQQLRTVLSSMVEGVIAIDCEQRILFANDRAGEFLDFHTGTAVGRPLWETVRQHSVQEMVSSCLADASCQCRELNWQGPQGRTLAVHVACLPGTPPPGAVLVVHDNTELRRLERLRQEFVANVSHELKTPLAVITACVETLLGGAVDDACHRGSFLHRIAEQAERLHRLILDLLQLARIESDTEVFSLEEVDLERVVRACLERHRTRSQGKKQELQAVPPAEGAPVWAWADEEAVQQILDNLVDNAVKYTPEQGRIQVRWSRQGNDTVVEVVDTGIGIPAHELPRVFERFYRVDKARSRELGGTGLGLSIVKHLVQAMRGSVQAASNVGQGSHFTIRLPAAQALP